MATGGESGRGQRDAERLRKRLWGATVLIAIAVLGLPLLLDGSGSESQFRRVENLRQEPPRIIAAGEERPSPDPEAAVEAEVPPPAAPAEAAMKAAAGESEAAIDDARERTSGEEVAAIGAGTREPSAAVATGASSREPSGGAADDDPMQAWVVQAGSFGEQRNAVAVRDRLRRAGFPSFVTDTGAADASASARAASLFRVQVGPMVDRARAVEARTRVIELLGREAIVVRYR